jgi:hypothetical protein
VVESFVANEVVAGSNPAIRSKFSLYIARLIMITMFVQEWLRLCAYCKSEHFDKGIFMSYHDNYEKAWKKLDFAQQGEISYRLSQLT